MDLDHNNVVNNEDMADMGHMEALPADASLSMNMRQISGNQKIDMWRNRNFDSGFQTRIHSEDPSIISSLHPPSRMSGISSVADYEQIPSLSDQQKQKFDGIAYGQTDVHYGSAVRAIPELTNLMKDEDHAVVHKAVYIMQNIAKMDSDPMRRQNQSVISDSRVIIALKDILRDKLEHPNIIRVALGTLFHICNRQEGLDLISHAISVQPDIILHIVRHIGSVQFLCYKYAILTLHSIVSDKQRGAQSLQLARQADTLKHVAIWLETEKSEKLLPVIVDLVRILCDKQNYQKAIFIKLGGPQKLLRIIQTCRYENLLWRSTQLLKAFSNYDANNLVLCGARDILPRLLTHESQRLVISTLETLRNISDVPTQYKEDVLLKSLLMLCGSRHPTVMLYTVQILSNLVANNKHNKEFLVCNHAVELLMRSLIESSTYMHGLSNKEAYMMEEYMESLICTIRQLCVGHSFSEKVQATIFKEPTVFLEKLLQMRPILLKQTMTLLIKLAPHNMLLTAFRDARVGNSCFVEQIVHIWKVSCNQLHTQEQIEGIRIRDLIQLSIEILRSLSRHQDLLEQIVYFLRTPENCRIADQNTLLPIFVLQKATIDETIKKSALLLIYNLVHHEQMCSILENNEIFINHLQQFQISQVSTELANYADNILSVMFEKKGRNFFARYSGINEVRPGNCDIMDTGGGELLYDSGEWPQVPVLGDPLMEPERECSKQFPSPTYNSPAPMFTELPNHPHPEHYYDQPSSSNIAYRHQNPRPPSSAMNHMHHGYDSPPVYPPHYATPNDTNGHQNMRNNYPSRY